MEPLHLVGRLLQGVVLLRKDLCTNSLGGILLTL